MSPSRPTGACLAALLFASPVIAQSGAALTAGEIKAMLPGKSLS